MISWNSIDTALLDMDGTLLDLHFDNHFWQDYVPRRYAETHGLTLESAAGELHERYQSAEGTLNWYCVDYWTRELRLDIPALKHELRHLIALRPYARDFLEALGASGKRRLLVTNAHRKALALKLECTALDRHVDGIVCSHDFGLPKEHAGFWKRLQNEWSFDPQRTLLVDDSLPVLRAARAYGVAHLVAVKQPDSRRPEKSTAEFPAIDSLFDLSPR